MLITNYPDIVRREGLAVEVVSGFASRSHGSFTRNPPAIVWHHDASPAGPSPGVLDWMISNWNNASANAWVDYNGKWWFVGAGVAWHAGAVLPGKPGNFEAMGIETDYTVGETIPWKLYDSLRRGTAAILRANGQSANDLHFHKTICSPVGRKSDPWALDLNTERDAVNKLIKGGNSPLPLPDPNAPGGPGGADPRSDWWFKNMATDAEKQEFKDLVRQAVDWWMTDTKGSRPLLLNQAVERVIPQIVKQVTDNVTANILHGERFKYENQPEGGTGTNDVVQSLVATNGQVYRNAAKLDQVIGLLSESPAPEPEPEAPKA